MPRETRILWAIWNCDRKITSFNQLTRAEASDEAAGREGRRGDGGPHTLVSGEEIARIQRAKERLGWDEARFEKWLRSPSSPLGKRSNPAIRTLGDANRVWWAMKELLKQAGKWEAR